MSLNLRSVALQGLGAGLLAFALQGLVPEQHVAQSTYYGGGKTKSARELDLEGHEDRVRAHWEYIEALRQATAATGGADRDTTQARSPAADASQAAQSRTADSPGAGIPETAGAAPSLADALALGARTEEEAALLLAVLEIEISLAQRPRDPDEDLAIALLLAAKAVQHPPSMAA